MDGRLDVTEIVADVAPVDALAGRFPVIEVEMPWPGHDVGLTRRRLRVTRAQPLGSWPLNTASTVELVSQNNAWFPTKAVLFQRRTPLSAEKEVDMAAMFGNGAKGALGTSPVVEISSPPLTNCPLRVMV